MGTISAFLLAITGSLAARVLTSIGIGIFSYAALSTLAGSVISAAQSNFGQIDSTVFSLINLGGIGESMGILSSALITKATMLAIKRIRPI
jgi:hypothetical protein